MLITLTQLKKSLQALKDFLLAKIPLKTSDLTNDSNFITADDAVQDVKANGTSVVSDGVANIPIANNGSFGLVKPTSTYGVSMVGNNFIGLTLATESEIKSGASVYHPIVPSKQYASTFYGLASASGDTTQSASSNPVGTYTDDAKASIKTMLGVEDPVDVQINGTSIVNEGVANIPVAKVGALGVVYPDNASIAISANGQLKIQDRPLSYYKSGNSSTAVVCSSQHISAFYGLAKAAGDTTQSASSNAVGTYTDEAKTAIKTMLGIDTITVNSIPTTEIDTLFA